MKEQLSEELKTAGRTLQKAEPLYVIMSESTRLPFVECDDETCDDEVLAFDSREMAESAGKELMEEGYLIRIMELPVKQRLAFFSSLFPIGVNAVKLNKGSKEERLLELFGLITRPALPRFSAEIAGQLKTDPAIKFHVENPEFHLTAIYYIQKVRNKQAALWKEEVQELYEEMMIHYREGYYISARLEDGGMPLLKKKNGLALQPLFTDLQEFAKFQRANTSMKIQNFIVSEKGFLKFLTKEASGIVINPFGISLVLQVKREPAGQA